MAKGFPPTQALYISDADGGNPRALTEAGDLIGRILWSPDGSTLLFPRFHDIMPRFAHIARVAAAGGPEDTPFGNFGDAVPFDGLPSWSGDGSRVALDHGGSIYVANADGSDRTLVSAGAYPQWSPTSDDIAYWEEDGHIHLIRPDGSGERGLGVEGVPRAWSPDGSRLAFIAFSSDTVPKAETWIALADGSNPVRIGPAGADVAGLAWSADSKRISYMARVPGDPVPDRWTIYLSSPDGSGTRVLVPASQILCCISSWRPSNPVAIAIHAGQ
jgi:Tol biopolymer transport system component